MTRDAGSVLADMATQRPDTIRILFVIDGRIVLTKGRDDFGLGYVLDTLQAAFSSWVRFEVHVAKRDAGSAGADGSHPLKYPNFKFTNSGFNLDAYDQVWFFGDQPSKDDGADGTTTDLDIPGPFALDDSELRLLAQWMDRGGGVFATGDHSILGASMCSRIPRVRTMRKWSHLQGVPTRDGSARHETLQPNAASPSQTEQDTLLQPLELVYRRVTAAWPFLNEQVPHPLLCSTQGVIDRFPDHMHEGEVIGDEDVQLDGALGIAGYNRPEYPFVVPEVLAFWPPGVGELRRRPQPHVIAYGQTTNNYFVPPVVLGLVAGNNPLSRSKRFGLVGAYDGDSVGLGRVVVDSTWHHWFSYNLVGIENDNKPAFQKMQAYYRNVGLWLATPAHRQSMLIAGTWGVLTSSAPMAFSTTNSPWQIGERIVAVWGQTVSPCMLNELVASFLDLRVLAASSVRSETPDCEPSWSSLPEDLVNRALVGGIGSALLDLALNHRDMRSRGQRTRLDAEAMRQRVVDGVSRGHALLAKAVDDAATAMGALQATLAGSDKPRPIDVRIPINVRRLRVVAESLQLPDPTDPALLGRQVALTIRIKLDDDVVAHKILEAVELPSFDARGGVIEFGRCDVGEVEVQTGERLTIELLVGSWPSKEPNPEALRFVDTLRGDASSWIGKSVPARSQAWRLWYRLEEPRAPSS